MTDDTEQPAIAHLRAQGHDPLRIWRVKAPKDVGGEIMAVFLQDESRVVIAHQFGSGKFALFEKLTPATPPPGTRTEPIAKPVSKDKEQSQ